MARVSDCHLVADFATKFIFVPAASETTIRGTVLNRICAGGDRVIGYFFH